MNHREHVIQRELIRYLKYKYNADPIPCNTEGVRIGAQKKYFKEKGNYTGILDLFYAYPNKRYHGLFIELKKEGFVVFKKDGSVRKSDKDILQKQWNNIEEYRGRGYQADFAIGLDEAIKQADAYFQDDSTGL